MTSNIFDTTFIVSTQNIIHTRIYLLVLLRNMDFNGFICDLTTRLTQWRGLHFDRSGFRVRSSVLGVLKGVSSIKPFIMIVIRGHANWCFIWRICIIYLFVAHRSPPSHSTSSSRILRSSIYNFSIKVNYGLNNCKKRKIAVQKFIRYKFQY